MQNNFVPCLAITLGHEGGYSNSPKDPGGATLNGVTQGTYDAWRVQQELAKRPVKQMEAWERDAIYQRNYWNAVNGDMLALGVDLATFDAAVNSGPARAKQWLLASVGGTDLQTIAKICAARLSFMRALSTWSTFGKGWANRVADIEARATKMAAGASAPAVLKQAAQTAAAAVSTKTKATAGVGAGGGAVATQQIVADGFNWPLVIGVTILAIAIAAILWKRMHDNTRAEAFAAVAKES